MVFQTVVDSIDKTACVVSVERTDNGYGKINIVTGTNTDKTEYRCMEEQVESFKRERFIRRLKMPLSELEDYYRRKRNFDRNKEIRHIALRRAYSKLFIALLGMDRALKKKKYQIIGDKRIHTGKAKIYCCTHAGSTDISVVNEALKDHCYWFWGDIGEYYKKIDGLLVWLNGAVLIDTRDKQDRRNALNTAIKVLKKGGNILIFPEGSWNITENKPVMHLYTGAVEMAIESGTDIIPVGIEIYGNTFHINIGRNISRINMYCIECHTYIRPAVTAGLIILFSIALFYVYT